MWRMSMLGVGETGPRTPAFGPLVSLPQGGICEMLAIEIAEVVMAATATVAATEPHAAGRTRRLGTLPARLRRLPDTHRRRSTNAFDETRSLLLGLAWIAALAIAASTLGRRTIRPNVG